MMTQTIFAQYNHDTVQQKNEPTSYTRLKNMAKWCLDQVTKDRHSDARNDRTAPPDEKEMTEA